MKKPKNYYGFAFGNCKKEYSKKYLKSKEGKKELKKCKKRFKKYRKHYKKHGWDPTETWNLDQTLANFVFPRLVYFRKNLHGYPGNLTKKEWKEILDKIIKSMKSASKGYEDVDYDEKEWKRIQEGFKLFGKYFSNLWD